MPIPSIEEFGQALVRCVRDEAIKNCDRQLQPDAMSPVAKRWREILHSPEDLAKAMVSDCVDETIAYLLQAIDQGLLRISFTSANGNTVNLSEEGFGELSGAYMGKNGWRATHSTERVPNDFSNLEL